MTHKQVTAEEFIKLKGKKSAYKIYLGRGNMSLYVWYQYYSETDTGEFLSVHINDLSSYFESSA